MKKIIIAILITLLTAIQAHAWTSVDKINTQTLSANKTLKSHDYIVQHLDPNGADRDITLPAESVSNNKHFIIHNVADGSGEDLVVKADAGSTIATLNPLMSVYVSCDGSTWKAKIMLPDGVLTVDGISGLVGIGTTDVPADLIAAASFTGDKTKRYIEAHSTDHIQVTVKGSNTIPFNINGTTYILESDTNVSLATDLDSGTTTAGTDYYVYAVSGVTSSNTLDFVISANSTWPSTYTADTSAKIGGFHLLCASVGTIAGHDLSGYLIGDILPASIWDLKHRPRSSPAGMVWAEEAGIWVDIYLASGSGTTTASVNGGTISDTRDWMDFVDDFAAVKKQLLSDSEFQIIAAGSNEETNITGSADPVTTGAHSDTAGRRMISHIGVEDAAGAMWQWLRDQSYRFDAPVAHDHVETGTVTATSGTTIEPTWGWQDLAGAKGSLYKQGTYGDVKLRAGGYWNYGTNCGSRSRHADYYRWYTNAAVGGRGRSLPQ